MQLTPLYSVGAPDNPPAAAAFPTIPTSYFYVIGNPLASGTETAPLDATATLTPAYDPLTGDRAAGQRPRQPNVVPPGYCPNLASCCPRRRRPSRSPGKPNTMPPQHSADRVARSTMQYYWVCLRRPANPFAPPQPDISLARTYNPMVVVDAMRFPYIEGGGTAGPPVTIGTNTIFSSQRCQPFRGGHAVRLPSDTSTTAAPLYTPYGYSEQMAVPPTTSTSSELRD